MMSVIANSSSDAEIGRPTVCNESNHVAIKDPNKRSMKTSLFARTALGASLLLASPYSLGQQRTEPIVVTATRSAVNPFDVAASIDVVDGETLRSGQLQVNLSETLARIPGINVQNRSNSTGLIFAYVAHGPLPTAHSN